MFRKNESISRIALQPYSSTNGQAVLKSGCLNANHTGLMQLQKDADLIRNFNEVGAHAKKDYCERSNS